MRYIFYMLNFVVFLQQKEGRLQSFDGFSSLIAAARHRMKYIRRDIVDRIVGSQLKQKAVAFALLLKEQTHNSSRVDNFSVYKVHKMTGMAYRTIRKYIDILEKMELAERSGDVLFIKKMVSRHPHRNIDISQFQIDKTKNIYNQLRGLLFLIIQSHKDFIRRILRLRKDPPSGSVHKRVRRICRNCCGSPEAEYVERGLSYGRIAMTVGCCVRTAINVVKDVEKRRWCKKHNHCERVFMEGVNYRQVDGFTFTTRDFGYIIRPNTYTLSRAWSRSLCQNASRYGILI